MIVISVNNGVIKRHELGKGMSVVLHLKFTKLCFQSWGLQREGGGNFFGLNDRPLAEERK